MLNVTVFKTFANAVIQSVSNLDYYLDVLNTPVKFSLRFVAVFYFLIAILVTVVLGLRTLPKIQANILSGQQQLVESLPDEILARWNSQSLTLEPVAQLTLDYPDTLTPPERFPSKLLIINTESTEFEENLPSLLYINQDTLFANTMSEEWNETPLTDILGSDELLIDKQVISKFMEESAPEIEQFFTYLPYILFPIIFIGLYLSRLIFIVFQSLIVHLIFTLMGKPIPYAKVFQLSLHLLVPVELIHQLSMLLYPKLDFSMLNISFWILMIILLWHMRHLQIFSVEPKQKSSSKK